MKAKETIHPKVIASIESCDTVEQLKCCFSFIGFYKCEFVKRDVATLIWIRSMELTMQVFRQKIDILETACKKIVAMLNQYIDAS